MPMKPAACLLSLSLILAWPAYAQQETIPETTWGPGDAPWSVNDGTLIGAGGYNLMDTYLSPGKKLHYTGWGLRILNERMKMTRLADYRISRQQLISVDIASTDNPAGTATDFAGFADYSLGYHYHFQPAPGLKLLAGASAHGMVGFIYNTRNGNNPASAKADIDLNLSGMAIYSFKIRQYPLTVRYQLTVPFAGVLFSPHYGQSYYEIFNLGNSSGIIQFNSFHNKFALKNYFTVDFPVANLTVRAGYLHSTYYTDVNQLQTHISSHSFLIGLVKEFVAFGGKRLRNTHKYRSAFY